MSYSEAVQRGEMNTKKEENQFNNFNDMNKDKDMYQEKSGEGFKFEKSPRLTSDGTKFGGSPKSDHVPTIAERAGQAKDYVLETAEAAKEKTFEAVGAVKEKAGEYAGAAKEKAGEYAGAAREKAAEAGKFVSDKAGAAKEVISEKTGFSKEKTMDMGHTRDLNDKTDYAKEQISDKADQAKQKGQEWTETAKQKGQEWTDAAKQKGQEWNAKAEAAKDRTYEESGATKAKWEQGETKQFNKEGQSDEPGGIQHYVAVAAEKVGDVASYVKDTTVNVAETVKEKFNNLTSSGDKTDTSPTPNATFGEKPKNDRT